MMLSAYPIRVPQRRQCWEQEVEAAAAFAVVEPTSSQGAAFVPFVQLTFRPLDLIFGTVFLSGLYVFFAVGEANCNAADCDNFIMLFTQTSDPFSSNLSECETERQKVL